MELMYEVVKFTPVDQGILRGFVDIRIRPTTITIRSIRYIKKHYAEFLQMPSKFPRNDRVPVEIVDLGSKDEYQKFHDTVLKQIHEKFIGEDNGTEQGQETF